MTIPCAARDVQKFVQYTRLIQQPKTLIFLHARFRTIGGLKAFEQRHRRDFEWPGWDH
jgi:hypothetical protein